MTAKAPPQGQKSSGPSVGRAAAVAFPIIVVVISILFGISYLISTLLRLPFSFGLPLAVRVAGGFILLAGLSVMWWVFKCRSPAKVVVSTYITFTKLFGKTPIAEKAWRTEPLVIDGPQKYVRNPLYFGIIVMVLGWGFLRGNSFVFVATVLLLLWFGLFLIPFEERELQALFGEAWIKYSEQTPMLIPFTKRRKKHEITNQLVE